MVPFCQTAGLPGTICRRIKDDSSWFSKCGHVQFTESTCEEQGTATIDCKLWPIRLKLDGVGPVDYRPSTD